MAFIHRIVGPDEELIGIAPVHWIYGARGVIYLVIAMAMGLALGSFFDKVGMADGLSFKTFLFFTFSGLIILLFYVIMILTTELGLTSKRIIYKRGWLMVDVKESDLEEIKAADVDNGILGRIFNYGYITFDARFVENLTLPAIADPYRYLKAMNEARSDLNDKMSEVVLHDRPPLHAEERDDAEHKKTHGMYEDRYSSLEPSSTEATASRKGDTVDNVNEQEPAPPQKAKMDVDSAEAHESEQQDHDAPEGRQQQHNAPSNDGPVVFEQDIKTKKQILKKRIMSVFSRLSKRN